MPGTLLFPRSLPPPFPPQHLGRLLLGKHHARGATRSLSPSPLITGARTGVESAADLATPLLCLGCWLTKKCFFLSVLRDTLIQSCQLIQQLRQIGWLAQQQHASSASMECNWRCVSAQLPTRDRESVPVTLVSAGAVFLCSCINSASEMPLSYTAYFSL